MKKGLALAGLLARLYGPLTALSNVRIDIMTALVSFERVFEVLSLTLAMVDQYPAWSVGRSNLEALTGKTCGMAEDVLVEEGDTCVLLDCGNGVFAKLRQHRDYVEGARFRDVQVSGPFARWVHTHRFERAGSSTRARSWNSPVCSIATTSRAIAAASGLPPNVEP